MFYQTSYATSGKSAAMGAIIAVIHKKHEDATETVLASLKTPTIRKVEAYGIASSVTIQIEKNLKPLQTRRLNAPIVIGYAFQKITEQDAPQPLNLTGSTAVFDGRTFPTQQNSRDVDVFAKKLEGNKEERAKAFVAEVEGDYAFAIANSDRLIAARDPLGVRPLYYGENKTLFVLASEKKALWNIGIKDAHSFPPGHTALVNEQHVKFTMAKRLACSKPQETTMNTAAEKLQPLIERAVEKRLEGLNEAAVAFSGGLDSSIIAFLSEKSQANVELIHVSLKDQTETEQAKTVADELRLPIHVHIYTEDDVAKTLPLVLYIIEEADPVKASIGIPIYWTTEQAAKIKLNVMLAGQGSDELFAGYKRYVDDYVKEGAGKSQEAICKDILTLHENNFERDSKICKFHGIEMRLPFAAYEIADFALKLPVELKIQPSTDTLRKLVLRKVAHNLGLSKAIVERPKKAVQYATGVSSALRKLAKRKHLTLEEYTRNAFQNTPKR